MTPLRACAALWMASCAAAASARADDFVVYSPYVIESQSEVELRGYRASGGTEASDGGAELSFAHAVNRWWKPEVYLAEYEKGPGVAGGLQGEEFENTFQLTTPGEFPVDFGFLASYEHFRAAHVPDALEFGPLFELTSGRFAHVVNLIWEKQVGGGAGRNYEFRYDYAGTYAASAALRPGIEVYGRPADRAYQAGPILAGEWHVPGTQGSLEYRAGVVLGINAAAPRQTWLLRLEYEFF